MHSSLGKETGGLGWGGGGENGQSKKWCISNGNIKSIARNPSYFMHAGTSQCIHDGADGSRKRLSLHYSATTTIALFRRAVGLGREVRGAGGGGGHKIRYIM